MIRKASACGKEHYLAVLDHKNTPSGYLNLGRAQRSLGRRTGTSLSMSHNL